MDESYEQLKYDHIQDNAEEPSLDEPCHDVDDDEKVVSEIPS